MHVYLPYRGEFGHKVMWHIHFVNAGQQPKVVCCEKGEEALYPGAQEYVYIDRKPDRKRRERPTPEDRAFLTELKNKLGYSNHRFISPARRPREYFVPQPYEKVGIEPCDVVVCPRKRGYGTNRNWKHWETVVKQLQERGVRVFAAGAPDSSFELNCPCAWDYDRFLDASLEAMHKARLVVSTDNGLAHLALVCARPLLLIGFEDAHGTLRAGPSSPGIRRGRFNADNHKNVPFRIIPAWEDPDMVVEEATKPMKQTYYFTITTPGRYAELAEDLKKSAQRHGIQIDVLSPEQKGNEQAKLLKIEGIRNAPAWADRIVFLDADTLIVDPTGLENCTGAILEPWNHKQGMYTLDKAPKEDKRRRLNKLYEILKQHDLSCCVPPGEYAGAEWNSGVLAGDRQYMQDLAERWAYWWEIVKDCNDGKFRRDQIAFKFAYIQVHKQQYGYSEDLPREYNWLIKRWGFDEPRAKILHKAGRPRAEMCRRWKEAKKQVFAGKYVGVTKTPPKEGEKKKAEDVPNSNNEVWSNPHKVCTCSKNCSHSGGVHSYTEAYQKTLEVLKPRKVLEWGPGPNTQMALAAGAEVFSIEFDRKYIDCQQINTPKWRWELAAVKDAAFVQFPNGETDWDLYFVDSRRRQECITLALQGKPDAVVCLHDAQRSRYHAYLKQFRYVKFLHKGFCVASNDNKILKIEV